MKQSGENFSPVEGSEHLKTIIPLLKKSWEADTVRGAHLLKAAIDEAGKEGNTPLSVIGMINAKAKFSISEKLGDERISALPAKVLALYANDKLNFTTLFDIMELSPEHTQKIINLLPDSNTYPKKINQAFMQKLFFVLENEEKILNGSIGEILELAKGQGLISDSAYNIFRSVDSLQKEGEQTTAHSISKKASRFAEIGAVSGMLYNLSVKHFYAFLGIELRKELVDPMHTYSGGPLRGKVLAFSLGRVDPYMFFRTRFGRRASVAPSKTSRSKGSSGKKAVIASARGNLSGIKMGGKDPDFDPEAIKAALADAVALMDSEGDGECDGE
jgi:hypothetical protein